MATHSSILAWETPWPEQPSRLQFIGLQEVEHDLATKQQQQRQPKARKIQHHQTSFIRKGEGTSLSKKGKATTRNKKITKWKKIISIDKYTVKVCLILSHFTNIADFINWRFVEALHSVSVGFIVSTAFTHFLSLSQIKQTQHSSGLKKQTDKTEPVFVENLLCTKHSFKL